jgi:hypothetical protein
MVVKVSGRILSVEARETREKKKAYHVVTLFSERGARSEVFSVRVWVPSMVGKLSAQMAQGQVAELEVMCSAYVDRGAPVVSFDVFEDVSVERNGTEAAAGAAAGAARR